MREPLSNASADAFAVREAALRVIRTFRAFPEEHEDLAADVVAAFVEEVGRRRAAGEPPLDNPAAWATRVARNLAIDRERWGKRRPWAERLPEDAAADEPGAAERGRIALERFLTAGARSPSFLVLAAAQCDAILAELDDDEVRLLEVIAEGRPYADAAAQLGLASEDVVRRRLNVVRTKARRVSEAAGYDTPWREHPRPYG